LGWGVIVLAARYEQKQKSGDGDEARHRIFGLG